MQLREEETRLRLLREEEERKRAERDQAEREETERARVERPAARESLILFYARHAQRLAPHFSMDDLQRFLIDRMGDQVPHRESVAAGRELRATLERIVIRAEVREVYEECAEAIAARFSAGMLELYLRDSMGDDRPIEAVREAAKQLRQILLQLYEDSPLKSERDRLRAAEASLAREREEIERMRAAGMTDDLIELELAERRGRANGARYETTRG